MNKATTAQRFVAYVIDLIIIFIVFAIFSHIVEGIIKLPELTDNLINLMPDNLKTAYNKGSYSFILELYSNSDLMKEYNEWMNIIDVKAFYNDYNKAYFTILGFDVVFLFIEWIIYFIIIPLHTKYQTVGRLFMKIRLVSNIDDSLSYGQLFKREILATLFISFFNYIFFVPLIINIVYIAKRNASLNDMFARTTLVRLDRKDKSNA